MATMITSECINCGACEPECPNTAIYQGAVDWQALDGSTHPALSSEIFYIVPEKCTECVGFHDHEACAAVCPVDCCVPNPDIPETHDVLLARARVLHPEEAIPDDAPSRFKTGAAGEAPAAAASEGSPAPAAPPVAAAAAPKAAAPAARPVAAARGKVEKATAPPPPPRPQKSFAHELPGDFDQIVTALGAARRRTTSRMALLPLSLLAVGQGVLGALPAGAKQRIEESIGDTRFFSAQLATAANVFLNLFLYPVVAAAIGVASGTELFSSDMQKWVLLGVLVALAEAGWRLREGFFRGRHGGDAPLRGAIYGLPLLPLGALIIALAGRPISSYGVGFDGFYACPQHFDVKPVPARPYGEVFRLEDRDDAYLSGSSSAPGAAVLAGSGVRAAHPDARLRLRPEDRERHVRGACAGRRSAGASHHGRGSGVSLGVHHPRAAVRPRHGLPAPLPGQDPRRRAPEGGWRGLTAVVLRPMRREDLSAVLEIERRAFSQPWSRAFFERELVTPFARLTVAMDESAPRAQLVGYSCRWRVTDEAHLLNVAVHQGRRGCGIGRRLVEA